MKHGDAFLGGIPFQLKHHVGVKGGQMSLCREPFHGRKNKSGSEGFSEGDDG